MLTLTFLRHGQFADISFSKMGKGASDGFLPEVLAYDLKIGRYWSFSE